MSRVMRLAAIVASLSCAAPVPTGPVPQQDAPFYYSPYTGAMVVLTIDPSRLTIVSGLPDNDLRDMLRAARVSVDSIAPPSGSAAVRVVWLSSATTTNDARRAADVLRMHAGILFASAAYREPGRDCTTLFSDVITVAFEAGIDAGGATRILATAGRSTWSSVQQHSRGDTWRWRFPVASPNTPLEVAAWFARQPGVRWSYIEPAYVASGCPSTASG